MSSPTEPTGSTPGPDAVAGEHRIGDIEREQAARQLVAAVGSGHLTVAEADRRIAQVYQARWPSELRTLLGDLPPATTQEPGAAPVPAAPTAPARRSRIPLLPLVLIVFGTAVFLGPVLHQWTGPAVLLVLGGLLLARSQFNHQRARP